MADRIMQACTTHPPINIRHLGRLTLLANNTHSIVLGSNTLALPNWKIPIRKSSNLGQKSMYRSENYVLPFRTWYCPLCGNVQMPLMQQFWIYFCPFPIYLTFFYFDFPSFFGLLSNVSPFSFSPSHIFPPKTLLPPWYFPIYIPESRLY